LFSGLSALLVLIFSMRFSGSSQSDITARLITKVFEGATVYGAIITNSGVNNLTLETLPDRAFIGTACTPNTILPVVVEKWNAAQSGWQEQETWISAVKTSGHLTHGLVLVTLLPKKSICAGWWGAAGFRNEDTLRLKVCTSFNRDANTVCLYTESFHPKKANGPPPKMPAPR
jgi:hypothetical protein